MIVEHPADTLPIVKEVFLQQGQHLLAEDVRQRRKCGRLSQWHEVRMTQCVLTVKQSLNALVHHLKQLAHTYGDAADTHAHVLQQLRLGHQLLKYKAPAQRHIQPSQ